jgi:hypothetical protein
MSPYRLIGQFIGRALLWSVGSITALLIAGLLALSVSFYNALDQPVWALPLPRVLLALTSAGLLSGFCQWAILRIWLPKSSAWILVSCLSWAAFLPTTWLFWFSEITPASVAFLGDVGGLLGMLMPALTVSALLSLGQTVVLAPLGKQRLLWCAPAFIGFALYGSYSLFSFGMAIGHISEPAELPRVFALVFGVGAISYTALTAPVFSYLMHRTTKPQATAAPIHRSDLP